MAVDRLCVPGLERPITLSEYARLEGIEEADVLAVIGQLKIPAAFFQGQWFVEAPPERGHPEAPSEPYPVVEARRYCLSELPRADRIDQSVHLDSAPQHHSTHAPQAASDRQAHIESEAERLRGRIASELLPYESLTASEKKALLEMTECAEVPQPVDYGLTDDETSYHLRVGSPFRHELPDGGFSKFSYKAGKWVRFRDWWGLTLAIFLPVYFVGFVILAALNPIPGGWVLDNPRALWVFFLGMLFPGCILWGISGAIAQYRAKSCKRRYVSNNLRAFLKELHLHNLFVTARREVEAAVRRAARDAELRKRSHWASLDGYAFERATAEVMQKHQFTAMVTPGSGDGGVDIQVTRNGLKGVVQCKAHIACVGPHVVRDLYGVIHHCGASFGIIVSTGGFTRGAIEFARDKPIYFLNTDDLIAMQEGRDVLASAFSRKDS